MANAMNYAMTRQGIPDLERRLPARSERVNVGPTERALSSVGGAVLAGLGASRGGLTGLGLAALGASLVYRGSTGHCSLYSLAGVSTAR